MGATNPWVLAQCEALTTLSLADCNLNDEAADELLDALAEAKLTALDLRWNRLDAAHRNGRASAPTHASTSAQKQKSAAERQTEALEASFAAAKAAKGKAGAEGLPPQVDARADQLRARRGVW